MIQTFERLAHRSHILTTALEMKNAGYRLAQIHVTKPRPKTDDETPQKLDIVYTFVDDAAGAIINYRIPIDQDEDIESVSVIYPYSYLYENEMKDLFGVRVHNINVDFKGRLYTIK
jgi:ech hydrogenase subunit D